MGVLNILMRQMDHRCSVASVLEVEVLSGYHWQESKVFAMLATFLSRYNTNVCGYIPASTRESISTA